jgi:hypothetical protein
MVGLIHGVAAVEHMEEFALFGVFFAALAAVQFAWGSRAFARPTPGLLRVGACLAWAVAGLWFWSRTVGLPIGPTPWQPEGVGGLDVAATSDELVLAYLALALVRGEEDIRHALRFARWPACVLLILSGVAMFLGAHHH